MSGNPQAVAVIDAEIVEEDGCGTSIRRALDEIEQARQRLGMED